MPAVEVAFLDGGFDFVEGGGVGLGELSTIGVAAAVGNAVARASGWEPMNLPMTPAALLTGLAASTRLEVG